MLLLTSLYFSDPSGSTLFLTQFSPFCRTDQECLPWPRVVGFFFFFLLLTMFAKDLTGCFPNFPVPQVTFPLSSMHPPLIYIPHTPPHKGFDPHFKFKWSLACSPFKRTVKQTRCQRLRDARCSLITSLLPPTAPLPPPSVLCCRWCFSSLPRATKVRCGFHDWFHVLSCHKCLLFVFVFSLTWWLW